MSFAAALEGPKSRPVGGLSRWMLPVYATLLFLFFYLPIFTIIVFAFDTKEIPGLPLGHLTLRWFNDALRDEHLLQALRQSIVIATLSASIATLLAIPAAMTLAWAHLPAKQFVLALILAPTIIPPLVIGLGALLLFRYAPGLLGIPGIVLVHTTLNLSFAALILYSRLLGFRRSLLEAAMDLGATELRTFFEIILPLSAPALIAAFLLCFTLSFDEFVAAWFVAGFERTLPIEIWGRLRYVISPEINAIATFIILGSIMLTAVAQVLIIRQDRSAVKP